MKFWLNFTLRGSTWDIQNVVGVHFHIFVVVYIEVVVAWPWARGRSWWCYFHDVEVLQPVETCKAVIQVDASIAAGIQRVLVHPVLTKPGRKVITCENRHLLCPLTLVTIHRVNLWVLRLDGLSWTRNEKFYPKRKWKRKYYNQTKMSCIYIS